jgi:hypothetical protein
MSATPHPIRVVADGAEGRILLSDSYTYCDARVGPRDVFSGGSFFGAYCAALALRWGAKGLIGHAAGIGRDRAGINGLDLCERYRIPAAACETRSARIGDGESLWLGRIGHVNVPATALGIFVGQPVSEAAQRMLSSPLGLVLDDLPASQAQEIEVRRGATGRVVCLMSLSLVHGTRPRDVFCVGSHGGSVLTGYAVTARPKGVIANDAGDSKDGSGYAALPALANQGIPAATVAADSARIGDPYSTWQDGVISQVNALAAQTGIVPGMSAQDAALRMLGN